jgi:hypothetical protein
MPTMFGFWAASRLCEADQLKSQHSGPMNAPEDASLQKLPDYWDPL